MAALPRALEASPPLLPTSLGEYARWIVSGIGASEGPARLLVGLLLEQGLSARFQPVTAFLGPDAPAGDVLVVVSQRLSPNARVPLARRGSYRAVVLLTTLDPASDERCAEIARGGGTIIRHGPPDEDGLLLRVLGPALATQAALRLASAIASARGALPSWAARLDEVGAAAELARARAAPLAPERMFGPTAIVTAGDDGALATGLSTKLLEALGVSPPIWDLCGLVHGPLQSFFEAERLLFVLEPQGDRTAGLLRRRLERIVDPARHRIHVLDAVLPHPLAYFEYASALDALILAALKARPRDLANWPGKGRDGPLYELDGPPGPDTA